MHSEGSAIRAHFWRALSNHVKIALVQKGIQDEDLKRHLLMHATRTSTNTCFREEVQSIVMARDTLSGSVPMYVSAVCEGKGKSKGKGNWKDNDMEAAANPDAMVI